MTKPTPHTAIRRRFTRREVLAQAAIFGGGLAWAPAPVRATDVGGTLRCQMRVLPTGDPRLFDFSEKANVTRGTLETLVRYTADFDLVPWLLERWEVAADGAETVLHLRPGVRWSNGDPFTADDVIFNLERWCEADVAGNSMADRMASLIDAGTGRARDGAIERLDDRQVRLRPAQPDITLIPSFADYPALLVHPSFTPDTPLVGTGPYALEVLEPGARATLRRRGDWWGGDVALDQIDYIDLGTDPRDTLAAFQADAIDLDYETTAAFLGRFDALGLNRREVLSGATLVARPNRRVAPDLYGDLRVRRALAMAVDNAVILELGYADQGTVAENHHVGPIHPEHPDLEPPVPDPQAALALMEEAGAAEVEHELISIDDEWNRASADAITAQLRDAGIRVRRRILRGPEFWAGWRDYPFSCTQWNMRPLGVQALALGYTSRGAWNETGFADPTFDATLTRALGEPNLAARRALTAELCARLIADGTMIQPYWRKLFLHHRPDVAGVRRHPMNEHHHDLWARAG